MKPIEPGCMAVVHGLKVNTEYNGLGVVVEGPVICGDRYLDEAGKDAEFIDSFAWLCTRCDWEGCVPFDAKNLLRIDGDPGVMLGERQDEEIFA